MIKLEVSDIQAVWLTLKLAGVTTTLLLIIATPLAWWLANTHRRYKAIVSSFVMLPLILPPTVLGFYLLLLTGPSGLIGKFTQEFHLGLLPFTFSGLVFGSIIFSFPFAVLPLQNAFEAIDKRFLEAAATLRAGSIDRFFSIVIPLAKQGFLSSAILTFSHTVGEFGVVLMIGGNIPGETQVLSIAIYNHVEALEYTPAHLMSGAMVLFSFVILFILYFTGARSGKNIK